MPTSDPSSPPTKFCIRCAQPFPLESFPFRNRERGTRIGRCRGCRNLYMTGYRLRQRAKRLGKTFADLRRSRDLDGVAVLANVAFRKFGGLNRFIEDWKRQFVSAKPGSRIAGNMLDAMVRLAEAVEANRPPKRDLSLVSDEDLERDLEERLARLYPDGRRNDR